MITTWDDRSKNVVVDLVVDDLAKGYDTADDAPFFTLAENRFPRVDGESYEPAFLLTGEKPKPGENERAALARMITSHPQFARATVNLIWGKLMTAAFVEPYNGFDLDRIDPDNPPEAPWTIQPTNPGASRSARGGLSRERLQHPPSHEDDLPLERLSARFALPRRVEGRLSALLPAQIRPGAHRPGARGYDRTRDGTSGRVSVLRHDRHAGQTARRAVRSRRTTRKRRRGCDQRALARIFSDQPHDADAGRQQSLHLAKRCS